MNRNLNIIQLALVVIMLLPSFVLAQNVVSRDFSHKYGQVSYIGKTRRMDSRVIIRSSLKLLPPKDATLGRYASQVSVGTIESFVVPAHIEESFLWDAMLAKQYLTVAQGYFQLATRYCAVNSPAHMRLLTESQCFYQKCASIFEKYGNNPAKEEIRRLVELIDSIMKNVESEIADVQFEQYYELYNKLFQTTVRLGDGMDEQYKCIVLN